MPFWFYPPARWLVSRIHEWSEFACDEAPLVLLGSDLASRIPSQQLDALLSRVHPAVVVVPDIRGRAGLPDLAHRLRKQLGVLE